MKELIAVSFLFIPLGWEILNDRLKETNHKLDVWIRAGLMIVCAVPPWFYGHSYLGSVALSFGIFFLLFDYLIHIIMLRRKDWFSFLGTTAETDKFKLWKNMTPWNRFYLRAAIFSGSLIWYIFG